MVLGNAVVFASVAFGLIPKVFDSINMRLAFHETLRMIDPKMAKRRHIPRIIARQRLAIDNAVGQNPLFPDWQEGFPLRIGNDLSVHSSASLQNAKDGHFAPSPTPPLAFAASAKITFVDFDGNHKGGNPLQSLCNDLPQPAVKEAGSIAMNADQLGGHSRRRPRNKMFEQPLDLRRPEFAILYVHTAA